MQPNRQLHVIGVNAVAGLVKSIGSHSGFPEPPPLRFEYDAAGTAVARIRLGCAADVVIVTRVLVDTLLSEGLIIEATVADLGVTEVGLAAKGWNPMGMPHAEGGLRALLLATPCIHLPDVEASTTRRHMNVFMRRLGLYEQVAGKLAIAANGAAAMRQLASSPMAEAVGFTQSTEILSSDGVRLVGALPGSCGLRTTYAAAVLSSASDRVAAKDYVAFLSGTATRRLRQASGFDEALAVSDQTP